MDVRTVVRAAARAAKARVCRQRPSGWYRDLMGERLPPPVVDLDRFSAVELDVHQLGAGHWAGSAQYLHRIGKKSTAECTGCNDVNCPAGLCLVCREQADVPRHVLLRCPALMTARLRRTGSIYPNCEEARSTDYVAAIGAATRRLQIAARLRSSELPRGTTTTTGGDRKP